MLRSARIIIYLEEFDATEVVVQADWIIASYRPTDRQTDSQNGKNKNNTKLTNRPLKCRVRLCLLSSIFLIWMNFDKKLSWKKTSTIALSNFLFRAAAVAMADGQSSTAVDTLCRQWWILISSADCFLFLSFEFCKSELCSNYWQPESSEGDGGNSNSNSSINNNIIKCVWRPFWICRVSKIFWVWDAMRYEHTKWREFRMKYLLFMRRRNAARRTSTHWGRTNGIQNDKRVKKEWRNFAYYRESIKVFCCKWKSSWRYASLQSSCNLFSSLLFLYYYYYFFLSFRRIN